MGMSAGQMAVVKLQFMVKSAVSLTINGVSCSSCTKSPRGPDHPVDFSLRKAIRLIVCKLTNKNPTEGDYMVVGMLQGGSNRVILPLQQFDWVTYFTNFHAERKWLMKQQKPLTFWLTCFPTCWLLSSVIYFILNFNLASLCLSKKKRAFFLLLLWLDPYSVPILHFSLMICRETLPSCSPEVQPCTLEAIEDSGLCAVQQFSLRGEACCCQINTLPASRL